MKKLVRRLSLSVKVNIVLIVNRVLKRRCLLSVFSNRALSLKSRKRRRISMMVKYLCGIRCKKLLMKKRLNRRFRLVSRSNRMTVLKCPKVVLMMSGKNVSLSVLFAMVKKTWPLCRIEYAVVLGECVCKF